MSLLSCPHKAGSSGRAASQWKVLSPETARERPRRPDRRRGRHACAALRCAALRGGAAAPRPRPAPRAPTPRGEEIRRHTRAQNSTRISEMPTVRRTRRRQARRRRASALRTAVVSEVSPQRDRQPRLAQEAGGSACVWGCSGRGGAGRWARGLSADAALERRAVLTCLRQ